MVKLPGARILLECLKREGVDTIFGLPGGAVLPIWLLVGALLPTLMAVIAFRILP